MPSWLAAVASCESHGHLLAILTESAAGCSWLKTVCLGRERCCRRLKLGVGLVLCNALGHGSGAIQLYNWFVICVMLLLWYGCCNIKTWVGCACGACGTGGLSGSHCERQLACYSCKRLGIAYRALVGLYMAHPHHVCSRQWYYHSVFISSSTGTHRCFCFCLDRAVTQLSFTAVSQFPAL